MRIILAITILFIISCNSSSTNEPVAEKKYQDLKNNINSYFNALAEIKKFNGGVTVKKDGETILSKVYHLEENEVKTLGVQLNSQFDIHSISKLMAKASVIKLEQEGKISKTDYISKYIPDFPNGDKIRITDLMEHQSGLPRRFSIKYDNLIDKNPEEIIALIKKEKLNSEPGTETVYSNLGYELLYYIISKVTNIPFVQYIDETFFGPLDMNDSGAHFHIKKDNLKNKVNNHEEDDGAIVNIPNIENSGMNQSRVYATMEDLLKFINYLKDEPFASELKNKNNIISGSGGGDGILSHVKADLSNNYDLVFFSNYDEIPFGKIIGDVEKIMTKQAFEIPKILNRKAIAVDQNVLKRYEGVYNLPDFNNNNFGFKVESDSLVFYQNGERRDALFAESDSTFFFEATDPDFFTFKKNENKTYDLIFNYKGMNMLGKKQ